MHSKTTTTNKLWRGNFEDFVLFVLLCSMTMMSCLCLLYRVSQCRRWWTLVHPCSWTCSRVRQSSHSPWSSVRHPPPPPPQLHQVIIRNLIWLLIISDVSCPCQPRHWVSWYDQEWVCLWSIPRVRLSRPEPALPPREVPLSLAPPSPPCSYLPHWPSTPARQDPVSQHRGREGGRVWSELIRLIDWWIDFFFLVNFQMTQLVGANSLKLAGSPALPSSSANGVTRLTVISSTTSGPIINTGAIFILFITTLPFLQCVAVTWGPHPSENPV